jgi:NitT/TauT family transport system substrate-binding protein
MRVPFIPLVCGLLFLCIIVLAGIPIGYEITEAEGKPSVLFVYASSGIMPQLLNTSQVDAFIVWESVISTADLGKIGRVIARDADFPPDHKWENTACNVLVITNRVTRNYPEISALLSAVTIAGIRQIQKDPEKAKDITANWVYGSKPIRSAGLSLKPADVEELAFQNIVFTDMASLPDLSRITGRTYYRDKMGRNPSPFMNMSVKNRAQELLNGSEPEITGKPPTIQIGYLPSSDLYAPLYVTIMDHEEICETYGFCLAPEPGFSGRPTRCNLIVHNQTVAEVRLLPGSVGGGVMTGLGQNAMDAAYIGSVPVLLQISMGNQASVIHSVNAGGSGLVVDPHAPCTDWDSFISWVRKRSDESRPVILAVPQSSIQEEMMREALANEGIGIILYGLPPRWNHYDTGT